MILTSLLRTQKLNVIKYLYGAFFILIFSVSFAQSSDSYTKEIMSGLSGKGQHTREPYLTPGDRSYIIGTQDGDFPDLGSHVKGEMGGLWMHPVKLMDGFWLKLTDAAGGSPVWLEHAKEFINYPYGNRFNYAPVLNGIGVQRFQYCPQGRGSMVIQFTLHNFSRRERKICLDFVVKTDLSPVWFSKENNIIDATDSIQWDNARQLFVAADTKNPWFVVWGSSLPVTTHKISDTIPVETRGMGKSASSAHRMRLKPGETITATFVISGSNNNIETARNSYEDVLKNYSRFLTEKKDYYISTIDRAKIDIPDKKLQLAYTWGKVNTEWLVCDVAGLGRFLGAGAVEYPWLFGCDNFYALQGVMACGDVKLAASTLRLLKNVSEKVNGNGRIIHEMSSNGYVWNKGNTQETAQFAVAVWKLFQWTGDKHFLNEMYPYIKKGLSWLLTEKDQNGNLFPEGYGIMEVRGLNAELIDVAVYTQLALEYASRMAGILNQDVEQKEYAQNAYSLKNRINTLFWDDHEGSYCDFYGTREQAILSAKGTIEQLQSETSSKKDSAENSDMQKNYAALIEKFAKYPHGMQHGWLLNKNWVISTPMETGIAPYRNAITLLNKVHKENCGKYGPYLSAVEKKRMMTIATGVQAMAEFEYGRADKGKWYMDKIVQTFSRVLPGSISEMMPDYGCPVQAWTFYGLAVPLVTKIFGINPDTYNKSVEITPCLPSNWDHIHISNFSVGENTIDFRIQKNENTMVYYLVSNAADWKYQLKLKGIKGSAYILNGKASKAVTDEITLYGKVNKLILLRHANLQ